LTTCAAIEAIARFAAACVGDAFFPNAPCVRNHQDCSRTKSENGSNRDFVDRQVTVEAGELPFAEVWQLAPSVSVEQMAKCSKAALR